MTAVRAVVFDLYGTLVELERSDFQRQLPRRLGIGRREWAEFVREVLLVTPFDDRRAFVEHALDHFSPERSEELAAASLALLDDEVASARTIAGARAVLGFLRRRGLGLGLISNLASPYREPFDELELRPLFDVVTFSCEAGRRKPDPSLYETTRRALGVAADQVLMVGDSLRNDVEAPRALGWQALRVSPRADAGPQALSRVGWLDFDGDGAPLLGEGHELDLGGVSWRVTAFEPLDDDRQGRYNLVARATVEREDGAQRQLYVKRFQLEASAWVEALVVELLGVIGLEPPVSGVLEGREALLWSEAAPGRPVDALELTPELARDIGRHGASAYLFANADLRPRNAFLVDRPEGQRLVMIDHEHCLFDLALDLEGIDDPYDPRVLDRLGRAELESRVRRRVLTAQAMRRTYRAFFGRRGSEPELVRAFRQGWCELHGHAATARQELEGRMRERLGRPPWLVVGTRCWRRALCSLDVDAVIERVVESPTAALDRWMDGVVAP